MHEFRESPYVAQLRQVRGYEPDIGRTTSGGPETAAILAPGSDGRSFRRDATAARAGVAVHEPLVDVAAMVTSPPVAGTRSTETGVAASERQVDSAAENCLGKTAPRSREADRNVPASVRRITRADHRPKTPGAADPHEFAWRVLRVVLEMLDGRRPSTQLNKVCAPVVVASMRSLVTAGRVPRRKLGDAQLKNVHVLPADEGYVEFWGTYRRGERLQVLAGRLVASPDGWQVTALRVD